MRPKASMAAVFDRIKLVLALLSMAALAYVFTFYLDADVGVIVCAFLIIAPLLSLLLAWAASRRISAVMKAPDTLQKGRHFTAEVTLTAQGRLPVPFVRVQLMQDANFVRDDQRLVQSAMTPAEPLVLPYGMTAEYPGSGLISCGMLTVSDYLGLFRFPIKNIPAPVQVGVIPVIPSLTGAATMLRVVSDVVLTMDEEEEESNASFTSQAMPGYIHRDYVPGDNLRRINWKMSAKRGKLLVRMDEAASAVRPAVILDLQHEITAEALKSRAIVLEGALGFLMLLVRQGIPCSLWFSLEGGWHSLELDSEDAVRIAAVELAGADFTNDGNRIPLEVLSEKAGAYMVYTTRPDAALDAQLRTMKNEGYVLCIYPNAVTAGQDAPVPDMQSANAVYALSEDFSMTAVRK